MGGLFCVWLTGKQKQLQFAALPAFFAASFRKLPADDAQRHTRFDIQSVAPRKKALASASAFLNDVFHFAERDVHFVRDVRLRRMMCLRA